MKNLVALCWRVVREHGLWRFCWLLVTPISKLQEIVRAREAELWRLEAFCDSAETALIQTECAIALARHERARADWWKNL